MNCSFVYFATQGNGSQKVHNAGKFIKASLMPLQFYIREEGLITKHIVLITQTQVGIWVRIKHDLHQNLNKIIETNQVDFFSFQNLQDDVVKTVFAASGVSEHSGISEHVQQLVLIHEALSIELLWDITEFSFS